MAVSKNDVLSFISEYAVANKRNAPRKVIVDSLGPEAASVIDELKKAGSITTRRGRTGGLVVVGAVETTATVETEAVAADEQPVQSEPDQTDDVAAQFAALMEKLEQQPEVVEAVPF